jgi:hypothetical protein
VPGAVAERRRRSVRRVQNRLPFGVEIRCCNEERTARLLIG